MLTSVIGAVIVQLQESRIATLIRDIRSLTILVRDNEIDVSQGYRHGGIELRSL